MRVAVIIPAYNEEERIEHVLSAVKQAQRVDQIIVVNDGSTDNTYEKVKADPRVQAIHLEPNRGKAGAMVAGARIADAEILVFLDADLQGLTPSHVEALAEPLLRGEAEMALGVFTQGRFITDLSQRIAPFVSGQRAVTREFFLAIDGLEGIRYGVETAITQAARARGIRVVRVPLKGVTHPIKEEKLGWWRGLLERARMYREILRCLVNGLRRF